MKKNNALFIDKIMELLHVGTAQKVLCLVSAGNCQQREADMLMVALTLIDLQLRGPA